MFLLVNIGLMGQSDDMSPYSRFGIGDLVPNTNPRNLGMGGISLGLLGKNDVSAFNPASYIHLDSTTVIFDFGVGVRTHELKQHLDDATVTNGGTSMVLTNLNLYLPITRWAKISFGLLPVSNKGYSVSSYNEDPDMGLYQLNYAGSGGSSKAYVGAAFGNDRISAGVNVNYLFGRNDHSTKIIFETDTLIPYPNNSYYNINTKVKGVSFDFGLQYKQPLNDEDFLGIGVTYTMGTSLNAKKNITAVGVYITPDTAMQEENTKGDVDIPASFGVGISYNKGDKWLLGVDLNLCNWSDYKAFGKPDNALYDKTAWNLAVGFERKTDRSADNYFGRMSYRAGAYYGVSYVDVEKKTLNDYGVTVGLGLPIKRSRSLINLGFELGRRGDLDKSQIQDTYCRIVVGISSLERWFYRPKFN